MKTSLNKRILSLVVVLCMSFTMMTFTTFATAEGNSDDADDTRMGAVLDFDSEYMTDYQRIDLYLSSANWSADFYAAVSGNYGARYEVDITTPGGTTFTEHITATGSLVLIKTLAYASAGTYTFEFYRATGSSTTALAIGQICD